MSYLAASKISLSFSGPRTQLQWLSVQQLKHLPVRSRVPGVSRTAGPGSRAKLRRRGMRSQQQLTAWEIRQFLRDGHWALPWLTALLTPASSPGDPFTFQNKLLCFQKASEFPSMPFHLLQALIRSQHRHAFLQGTLPEPPNWNSGVLLKHPLCVSHCQRAHPTWL